MMALDFAKSIFEFVAAVLEFGTVFISLLKKIHRVEFL